MEDKFIQIQENKLNDVHVLLINKIFLYVNKDEIYNGSFEVKTSEKIQITGKLYSTNYRMQCKNIEYIDNKLVVYFKFDSMGLNFNDLVKGKFLIVTEFGEYKIDYTVSIIVSTNIQFENIIVSNFNDFKKVAINNYLKAYNIFINSKFKKIIKNENKDINDLYDYTRRHMIGISSLEQFFVLLRIKNPINISLDSYNIVYKNILNLEHGEIVLKKNTWGYKNINVFINGNFIVSDIIEFSTLNFEKNQYIFKYKVLTEKLKEGKNICTIKFITIDEELVYKIVILNNYNYKIVKKYKKERLAKYRLISLFLNYRLNNVNSKNFLSKILKLGDKVEFKNEDVILYKLYKAYAYIENEMNEEAKELLNSIYYKNFKNIDIKIYILYIYIYSKINKNFENILNNEIEELYEYNKDDFVVFLLYLKVNNVLRKDPDRYFAMLENYFHTNKVNIFILLESYNLILNQISFISELTPYIIRILIFAKRKHILTKNIINDIVVLANRQREFLEDVLEILEESYKINKTKKTLSVLCKYLILGGKISEKYFKIYELGVVNKIYITNLYEYYINSINENENIHIAKQIYLYFNKNKNLNYKKFAFIYVYLLKNKEYYNEFFSYFKKDILEFVVDCLQKKLIDKNLKILYKYFFKDEEFLKKNIKIILNIIFYSEISVELKNISKVIVLNKGLININEYNCVDGKTFIKLYTDNDIILFKDIKSNIKYVPYKKTPIFNNNEIQLILKCNKDNTLDIGPLIYMYYKEGINSYNVENFNFLIKLNIIRDSFKIEIKKKLLLYYFKIKDKEKIFNILQNIELKYFNKEEKNYIIEIFLSIQQIKKTFSLLKIFGFEYIKKELLLTFLNLYLSNSVFLNNSLITYIAIYLINNNYYNQNVLIYVEKYFVGEIEKMIDLLNILKKNNINIDSLEERIIFQMIFCKESFNDEIFIEYYNKGNNKDIKKEYLTYRMKEYFSDNCIIDNQLFDCIINEYKNNEQINIICKLSFVKYYSKHKTDQDFKKNILNIFLKDIMLEGYVFSFLKSYNKNNFIKLFLLNKVIVQYQGLSSSNVIIKYNITQDNKESGYVEEIMPQYFKTYYIKEFILYSNEKLKYYIFEKNNYFHKIVDVNVLKYKEYNNSNGKFYLLNKIIQSNDKEKDINEYEEKIFIMDNFLKLM